MANRILRDWTASESIDGLSEGAEIFFTRLIMKADDFGCFYGNPKLLHSALFPLRSYSNEKILQLRDECRDAGIIEVYRVDGKDYVKIKDFGQRLRLMSSKFPQPPDSTPLTNDGEARTVDSIPPPETKRSRNEGEEKVITPETFKSNQEAHEFLTTNYQDVAVAKKMLSNRGWPSANEKDIGALAYHFVEKNLDLLRKPRGDVRQHFTNWLDKRPIDELTKLSIKIQANAERKRQSA